MTVNSYGPHGEPVIADPPTTVADMTALAAYTATVGNRIADSAAHRTAFQATFGFAPYAGLEYYELDTKNRYVHDGTAWRGTAPQGGTWTFAAGDFTADGTGFSASKVINFVPGRFTATPAVTATSYTQASTAQHPGAASPSTSGFTLYYWRATATSTTVNWAATPTDS